MTATQTLPTKTSTQKLQGKVALVTGSSRGIGAAIARKLAAEGAIIAVNYSNSKEAAEEVAASIADLGTTAKTFKANVAVENEARELVEQVVKEFGKIDILVNNAAIWEAKPVEQIDLAHYDRVFNVNLKGVVATTIAALPHIQEGGRIINISSGAAKATIPGASVYSAAKSALETLTRIWGNELGARKITVNAVAPGTTATEMLLQALDENVKQQMIAKTPLGRLGESDDIANVVAFVATEEAGWITSQTINVDGGLAL